MALIGLNGYSSVGKDAVGQIILSHDSSWEIKKFAGKLKQIASILTGIDEDMFEDQDFKKSSLPSMWDKVMLEKKFFPKETLHTEDIRPMTVRQFLQELGTDAMRNGLHDNVWVNALMADYQPVLADRAPQGWDWPNWVVTDTRFPNEAQAIEAAGGFIIRVDRPGIKPINNHPSEVGLDNWNFKYKILNGSDLTSLAFTVENILKKEKLWR